MDPREKAFCEERKEMRDLARIDEILNMIKILWKRYPDMRFGQLLINLGIADDGPATSFNREDEDLRKILWEKLMK